MGYSLSSAYQPDENILLLHDGKRGKKYHFIAENLYLAPESLWSLQEICMDTSCTDNNLFHVISFHTRFFSTLFPILNTETHPCTAGGFPGCP